MTEHRPPPNEELVQALLSRVAELPPAERATFLRAECATDDALREEVERRLSGGGGPDSSSLPAAIGRYRIVRRLGAGGMGVVYQAQDEDTGRPVAVKTVRVPRAGLLESIRHEIHVLTRLEHPGIVTILDEGVHEGSPWYAMELLHGTLLRDAISRRRFTWDRHERDGEAPAMRWWTGALNATTEVSPSLEASVPAAPRSQGLEPADLIRILTLVRRVCEPVAYMHGEGLVHRDLKPDNILVRPDGRPVIVDFGLMSQFGGRVSREVVEVLALGAGTRGYMAPEQARGEVVDARADLYALGGILFELVTGLTPPGRPGSVGASRELVGKALDEIGTVPPVLAGLIQRLLEPDPRRRIGYAVDVAARLAELGAEGAAEGPPPRAYLYRPGLAGRATVYAELERILADARRGNGRVVMVGGESGVGKSRLVAELAMLGSRQGIEVLVGECDEHDRAALRPFAQPLQALGDRCRERGEAESERVFGRRARVLAIAAPALRSLPGLEHHPEPVELAPASARARVYADLVETLRQASRERPLLVVLEDLHWADELTVGFLEQVADIAGVDGARLVLLGTHRSDEASAPLRRVLDHPGVRSASLSRLDEAAVGLMAMEMLALERVPPPFARFLLERSEGVPFFVAEYLREAVRGGLLRRDDTGAWRVGDAEGEMAEASYRALPLPGSLKELLARRLGGLGPAAHVLLDVAAVLGRESPVALLGSAAARSAPDLWDALRELEARQVIEPAGEAVRFSHDRLREAAYDRIEEARRVELHRAAAAAIERLHADSLGPHLAALGRHWERGGELEKAGRRYVAAGFHSLKEHGPRRAEGFYRKALECLPAPDVDRVKARNELGNAVLHMQGRFEESLALYAESLAELEALRSRAGAEERRELCRQEVGTLRISAASRTSTGRLDLARELLERAVALAREHRFPMEESHALSALGIVDYHQGELRAAQSKYERALAICRAEGELRGAARILLNLALLLQDQGELERSERLHEETLAVARESGDRPCEQTALGNVAILYIRQGRLSRARQSLQEGLRVALEAGNRVSEGILRGNLACLELDQGNLEAGAEQSELALRIHRETGARRYESSVLARSSEIDVDRGDLDAADRKLQSALAMQREGGFRQLEVNTLHQLATLQIRAGRLEAARQALEGVRERLPPGSVPGLEGILWERLSDLEWWMTGDAGRSAEYARRGEELRVAPLAPSIEEGLAICGRGRRRLRHCESAAEQLRTLEALAATLETGPRSALGREIAELRGAQEAFERGVPLVGGIRPQDVAPGLVQWLRDHRPEALAGDGRRAP